MKNPSEVVQGEGAFFPLVFYSAARLPGSLVQVLNQTLIPSTAAWHVIELVHVMVFMRFHAVDVVRLF